MTGRVRRREAGRVILLDQADRVFLLHGTDVTLAPRPTWWFTPGGGCDPGEGHRAAAIREVFEELGLQLNDVQVVGPVHERFTRFEFEGVDVRQYEQYFAARTASPFCLDDENWSETERRSVVGHAWWDLEQLRRTRQTVYPAELADVAARLVAERAVPSL